MSVRELLQRRWLDRTGREAVRIVLAHPAGWPRDPALEQRARDLDLAPTGVPSVGTALLVSVSKGRGSVWLLSRGRSARAIEFIGEARKSLEQAKRAVTNGLPFVVENASLLGASEWAATPLVWDGLDRSLDGRSFGVAMRIAMASVLLDTPASATLCASAAVGEGGALEPVDEIATKIAAATDNLLGLETFVVAATQPEDVESYARGLGARFSVRRAATVSEALALAFPDLESRLGDLLATASARARVGEALFLLALAGSEAITDWSGIARSCAAIEAREPAGTSTHGRAHVAGCIARRHANLPSIELPFLDERLRDRLFEAGSPRARHIQYHAHWLQSSTDSSSPEHGQRLLQIRDAFGTDRERTLDTTETLMAVGALARALSATRRYDEALPLLEDAVRGWCIHFARPADASRPLCELLRVGALLRIPLKEDVRRWIGEVERAVSEHAVASGYLRLARARASVLMGAFDEASAMLAGEWTGGALSDDVRWSARRWSARAAAGRGDVDTAREQRRRLQSEARSEPFRTLSRLDERRELGEGADDLLQHLRGLEQQGFAQGLSGLLTHLKDGEDPYAVAADEYPY